MSFFPSRTCPLCESDVEHLLHVFFNCPFAARCWQYAGGGYDMHLIENAPEWLLHKISTASTDELVKIAKVLWGVWFFKNKKV